MVELIDISKHNVQRAAIDWPAVKAAGITGVMIRIGWAGYNGPIAANNALDANLDACIKGAHAAGLDVGLYVYTYTKTPAAAKIAAAECVSIAKKYPGMINLPIAFDVEHDGRKKDANGNITYPNGWDCLIAQGKSGLTDTVIAFLEEAKRLGYYALLYTYTSFAIQYLDRTRLAAYDLWIADYRGNEALMQIQLGRKDYGMWQHLGDKGTCDGVTGACDRNYCYRDYPAEIAAAGLNGWGKADKPSDKDADTDAEPDYKALYEEAQAKLDALKAGLAALVEKYK